MIGVIDSIWCAMNPMMLSLNSHYVGLVWEDLFVRPHTFYGQFNKVLHARINCKEVLSYSLKMMSSPQRKSSIVISCQSHSLLPHNIVTVCILNLSLNQYSSHVSHTVLPSSEILISKAIVSLREKLQIGASYA